MTIVADEDERQKFVERAAMLALYSCSEPLGQAENSVSMFIALCVPSHISSETLISMPLRA